MRCERTAFVILASTVLFLLGCNQQSQEQTPSSETIAVSSETDPSVQWQPLSSPQSAGATQFRRLPPNETGVDFVSPIDTSHSMKRLYAAGFLCGGVAIGDFNGDQLPDLYLVNGPKQNRLYLQTGPLKFEDHTKNTGGGSAWGASASVVDIDNDGDDDIYVCNYDSPNQLYLNQGNATFVEAAEQFGLDVVDASFSMAFCDYDRDGDLDAYLMTNRYYRAGGLPADLKLITEKGQVSLPEEYQKHLALKRTGRNRGALRFVARPDRLFRNDGGRSFLDVTSSSGISEAPGHGLSATWWDYNDDGLLDLYVGNDFDDPDHLYRNNGDGTFTDTIEEHVPHTSWFSMGADVGDINNDGLFDFVIADMSSTTHFGQKTTMGAMGKNAWFLENARPLQYMRNALYLNTGTDRFMEIAYLSGIDSSDWTWTVRFADLDNDGFLDLFVTNGMSRNWNNSDLPFTIAHHLGKTKWDLYEDLPPMPQKNLAFRNRGDLRFEDASRPWGLDHHGMSFGAATGDLDRDGDIDLIVANLDEPVSIFRNDSTDGHRVLMQLHGTASNRRGIGAKVMIETADGRQVRQLMPIRGFLASHESILHFGLGELDEIQRVQIDWPSGRRQTLSHLPADRLYTITEPPAEADVQSPQSPHGQPPLYRAVDIGATARHRETSFDDFRRQPLLPNKLSQLGPGIAVGDVDQDDDDDFFLAGAAGQAGMLMINKGLGEFREAGAFPFSQDAAHEDMAPLFFDADGDRDLDLYVSSGGVECDPDDPVLQDRLYLNDGHGNFFKAASDALPRMHVSTGTVSACDFDRDGDLDLFVGGRVVPGQFPISARSFVLRNSFGRFEDVTKTVAPSLEEPGMVTSAIWSDANGDGWLDLLMTLDWGSVKYLQNVEGTLQDRTKEAGLEKWTGWWNGIAGRDLDGDGDIDYVATNVGLNTKYHASADHPAQLYYGDFDGSGKMNLVEAEFENGTVFPIRGRSCSSNAMPFVSDKFASYKDFALASLEEIYTPECLTRAHGLKATTLASGVFLNNGDEGFSFAPLPNMAQAAPGFGLVLTEVDGDGAADLYVVQNFFGPQVETGRMDGGISLLLQGNGDGTFRAVWPDKSGLVVPGDAKGLAVIDLNKDDRPDFLVGMNDQEVRAFQCDIEAPNRSVTVQLVGADGNPSAVGARVTVVLDTGKRQTAEVTAGSGYLSQSTSVLSFGLGESTAVQRIDVTWPDGNRSSHSVKSGDAKVVIQQAAARET